MDEKFAQRDCGTNARKSQLAGGLRKIYRPWVRVLRNPSTFPHLPEATPNLPAPAAAQFIYRRPRRGPWFQMGDAPGLEWNLVELTLDQLPEALDGARLVHIGDIHLRTRWMNALDEVIAKLNQNPPDLLLYSGDFVEDRRDHRPALPLLRKLLSSIHATFGAFATLGNHDGDLLLPHLTALNVHVITHHRIEVSLRGEKIELIGFPGPHRWDLDEAFLRSIPPKTAGMPRIILSHYPDLIRAAGAVGLAPDLFLAGHTHGGQVCLPGEIQLLHHDSLPGRLCKGVHDYRGTCLIVTRGLGFSTLPLRLFCPAEIIEIVLRKSPPKNA